MRVCTPSESQDVFPDSDVFMKMTQSITYLVLLPFTSDCSRNFLTQKNSANFEELFST